MNMQNLSLAAQRWQQLSAADDASDHQAAPSPHQRDTSATCDICHAAARGVYVAYADGDTKTPLDFSGKYSFADQEVWRRIDATLGHLATTRRKGTLKLLDAGCGPGTWLKRMVLRAQELGFRAIEAHGFDLSPVMVQLAKSAATGVQDCDTEIKLYQYDIAQKLPYDDDEFDITVCLDGVFNHLTARDQPAAAAELARVTRHWLYVTARSVGSPPNIHVDDIDADRADGRALGMTSHLFSSHELRALFAPFVMHATLAGLDLFHERLAPGARDVPVTDELGHLERHDASDPRFIDRAAHILLIGEK